MSRASEEAAQGRGEQSARHEVHLRDYLSVVYKRLSVIIVTAVTVFVFVALPEAQKPRLYRTSASLLVKPPSATLFNTQGATYYLMSIQDFQTQLYLMKSKRVAMRVIEQIVEGPWNRDLLHELGYRKTEQPSPKEWEGLADAFRARLTVSPVADTHIVNLSYSGGDPKQIQRLLALYCKLYVQYNGERDRLHLEASERQLDLLRPQLESNVDDQVMTKRELIKSSPSSQQMLAYEQRQLDDLGSDLGVARARQRELGSQLDRILAVLMRIESLASDANIVRARAELQSISEKQEKARSLTDEAEVRSRALIQLASEIGTPEARAAVSRYRGSESMAFEATDEDSVRIRKNRLQLEQERRAVEDLLLEAELDRRLLSLLIVRPEIADLVVDDGAAVKTLWESAHQAQAERDTLPASASAAAVAASNEAVRLAQARLEDGVRTGLRQMIGGRRGVADEAEAAVTAGAASRASAQIGRIHQAALAALDRSRQKIAESPADLEQLLGLAAVLQDENLVALSNDLRALEVELAQAMAKAKSDGRVETDVRYLEAVQAPTEAVRQKKQQVVDHVYRALDSRALIAADLRKSIDFLREQLDTQVVKVARLELAQTDFARIAFNIETAQDLLRSAVKEHQRVRFDSQLRENNVSIVEDAREPGEYQFLEPDIRRAVLMGIVFGLVAGFGLAFVLEYLDDTIKTTSDIDRYVGAPILGAIPTMVNKAADRKDLIAFYEPKASISEAFRSVRTSLLFASSDTRRDTFVVTSVGPREGKTTVSMNLAITLAQAGSRTLLVDCDLRRPRVHKAFGIRENFGLTNVLVGGGAVEEFARETDVPNLFLLTSGPIPPNPSELVGSKKMRDFFDEVRGKYDKIIYDTPPLAAVTDGVIIGGMVDGLVLVISSAKTTKKLAQRARESLDNVGVPVFGVVLNNVKATHGYYYYSSYYRYYGEEAEGS